MNKLNQRFLSLVLLLSIFVGFFWIYKEYKGYEKSLLKDRINVCFESREASVFNICNETFKNHALFLNPLSYYKQKKIVDREIEYWRCFDEEYKKINTGGTFKNEEISKICSQRADELLD